MTREELRSVVLQSLGQLAPEADLTTLEATASIREELDLDSFDFVRFITSIDERLGLEVPEADYTRLETLGGCLDYLQAKIHP